jgi:hypothetical protein
MKPVKMKWWRIALHAYGISYFAVQLVIIAPVVWRRGPDRDLVQYYIAAERVWTGESMYDVPPPGPIPMDRWRYLYPPFLVGAIAAAAPMSFATFSHGWLILMLVCYWIFAAALARISTGDYRDTLAWGGVLSVTPGMMHGVVLGNADTVIWALAGVAFAFPQLRTGGLTLAALVKPYTAWPALVSLTRDRNWLGMAGAVVLASLGSLVSLGTAGLISESIVWLRAVLPVVSQGDFVTPGNMSLSFLPLRIAYEQGWRPEGILPLGMRLYLTGISIAAPLAVTWWLRRHPPALQVAAVLVTAIFTGPVVRHSYLPLLLIPIALGVRYQVALLLAVHAKLRLGRTKTTSLPSAAVVGQS